MSIGKRVGEAIDKMEIADAEAALFAICVAIEATATKEFGKPGRSSYKDFIDQNFSLISNIALGRTVEGFSLEYDHPDLKKNPSGIYPIQDIFYHAVRCGLYHQAGLPSNLKFIKEKQVRCNQGALCLPSSLVYGLIVAVVVAPVNNGETLEKPSMLNFGEFPIPISKLWGRRSELLWLLDAEAEVLRLQSEARRGIVKS